MSAAGACRSELAVRISTAVVLVAAVIAILYWVPNPGVAFLLGLVALAGAWEWSALANCRAVTHRHIYVFLTLVVMACLYPLLVRQAVQLAVWGLALAWWVTAAAVVLRYQLRGNAPAVPVQWRLLAGWMIIVPAWAALVILHRQLGATGVLALLVLIWAADSAAYFFGRRFGRRRLASRVSPGKSWEGLAAAVVVAVLIAAATAGWTGIGGAQRGPYVLLAAAVVMFSVVGDLTESLFKRVAGMKDSGSILPGHGGVLDRVDSLTAAAPVFVLGLRWLEGSA